MGDGFDWKDKKPEAKADEPLVLHILESLRRDRNSPSNDRANSSAGDTDLLTAIRNVEAHTEEIAKLKMMRPGAEYSLPDAQGMPVKTTVYDRLRQIEPVIEEQFEKAIKLAKSVDRDLASELLAQVNTILSERRQELSKLGHTPDLFQAAGGDLKPAEQPRSFGEQLDTLSYSGLQLLGWQLKQAIIMPQALREQYADYLTSRGDFARAYEQLVSANPLDGNQRQSSAEMRDFLTHQLRRQELAGGDDPITLAWRARDRARCADMDGYFRLMGQAERAADSLNVNQLNERVADATKQLAEPALASDQVKALQADVACLEELLHSKATVQFAKIWLAARDGDFGHVKELVQKVITTDKKFASDCSKDLLDALYLANTSGQSSSVWEFNQHLVKFQSSLSPQSFDTERAIKELDAAARQAERLPFAEIKTLCSMKSEERSRLETDIQRESDPNKRAVLSNQLKELDVALEGLNLLAHAPSYCKLMEGVFELANRNNDAALKIFDELVRTDPEFAAQSRVQLHQLKEAARMPGELEESKSRLRELIVDLTSSSIALLAATAVVTGTALTGPGALVAGALTGSATKTFVRAAMGESIRWHDPVFGAVDGLAGSAGLLAQKAAMTAAANSARNVAVADRALATLGISSKALEGLSGVERLEQARKLSRQALRTLDHSLPWHARLGKYIPYMADNEYYIAARAYAGLARQTSACAMRSALAGSATAACIRQGGQRIPSLFEGRSENLYGFSTGYLGSVASDVGCSMLVGSLGSGLPRTIEEAVRSSAYGIQMQLHTVELRRDLDKIEKILEQINRPKTPESIREHYLSLPGPKVDPRLGEESGQSYGRR